MRPIFVAAVALISLLLGALLERALQRRPGETGYYVRAAESLLGVPAR